MYNQSHTYIQQIFMMRHSPKAQGAYNEEQNCEENVQIYNIMKKNQSIRKQIRLKCLLKAFTETDCLM